MLALVIVGMALTFAASGLYAGTKVEDTFKMDTKEFKEHKKGNVTFAHKEHIEKYNLSCGDCHHDANGKPLDIKMGDDVQRCVECHTETEKVKGEKLAKKEKIKKYLEEAFHANCIGCHKDFNVKNGDPKGKAPAPTSCTKCHPKK